MLTSLTAPAPRAVALPDEFESVPASAGRFRPDIEGMRGIAVLLVVVFHAGVAQLPGGFVGVDVFFVISGFLITRLLVHEMSSSGWISLRNFYLRRARRLLPALALVTSATVLMAVVVMPPLDAARVGRDGFWSSLYLANVHFMQARLDYFAPTGYESPLLHVWSLAVEEQFYVIWPLLLILAARILNSRAGSAFGLPLVAVTVASFVISLVQSGLDPTTAYFSPFTRAWELGLGGIVAICWASAPPRAGRLMLTISAVAGMVAIAAGAVLLTEQTLFPGTAALLPVGGAALVLLTAPGTLVGRALSWGPLQAIGGISYSLYLWHWPLLVLGGADGALRSSLSSVRRSAWRGSPTITSRTRSATRMRSWAPCIAVQCSRSRARRSRSCCRAPSSLLRMPRGVAQLQQRQRSSIRASCRACWIRPSRCARCPATSFPRLRISRATCRSSIATGATALRPRAAASGSAARSGHPPLRRRSLYWAIHTPATGSRRCTCWHAGTTGSSCH